MVPVLLEVECWPVARHTASEPTNGETLTHGRPQPKRLAQLNRSTEQGRLAQPNEESPMTFRESDQLIVLSERESRLQGEGADRNTQVGKGNIARRGRVGAKQCKPLCWQ